MKQLELDYLQDIGFKRQSGAKSFLATDTVLRVVTKQKVSYFANNGPARLDQKQANPSKKQGKDLPESDNVRSISDQRGSQGWRGFGNVDAGGCGLGVRSAELALVAGCMISASASTDKSKSQPNVNVDFSELTIRETHDWKKGETVTRKRLACR